jgi:3-methyladenine DNA glycosylase AlkC
MDPLKEMFNRKFYQHFAGVFADADKNFNSTKFLKDVTTGLDDLSLNARLRNTSTTLQKHLPADFAKAVKILYKAAPALQKGYTALVLPDFIALYGQQHFDLSMEALRRFTSMGSSEFAIREFLKRDLHRTLTVMQDWARDKDPHVRRLASEGSRPRLPWSFRLDAMIKDPSLTTPILEQLKADGELYVRKSVANHLNDISKDNTPYMLQLVKSWDATHPSTAWIIKHASRTLIKKGDPDSLSLFAFEKNVQVHVNNLRLQHNKLKLGDALSFAFDIVSDKKAAQKLVVDYAIHYAKSSGQLSRKVFKLKELVLEPGQTVHLSKKQVIKDMTTRKHYMGRHTVEIMVNGKTYAQAVFILSMNSKN